MTTAVAPMWTFRRRRTGHRRVVTTLGLKNVLASPPAQADTRTAWVDHPSDDEIRNGVGVT